MREMKPPPGNPHHPYCAERYMRTFSGWSCVCDTLKAYDKWRHDSRATEESTRETTSR